MKGRKVRDYCLVCDDYARRTRAESSLSSGESCGFTIEMEMDDLDLLWLIDKKFEDECREFASTRIHDNSRFGKVLKFSRFSLDHSHEHKPNNNH